MRPFDERMKQLDLGVSRTLSCDAKLSTQPVGNFSRNSISLVVWSPANLKKPARPFELTAGCTLVGFCKCHQAALKMRTESIEITQVQLLFPMIDQAEAPSQTQRRRLRFTPHLLLQEFKVWWGVAQERWEPPLGQHPRTSQSEVVPGASNPDSTKAWDHQPDRLADREKIGHGHPPWLSLILVLTLISQYSSSYIP